MPRQTSDPPASRALRAGAEFPILASVNDAPGRGTAAAGAGPGDAAERYLLVQAGADHCVLPLSRVRRIVRDLAVVPLPGTAPELKGLAEFGGEPLPVIDLARLVGAAPGAAPPYPVTVLAWAGAAGARELVGLAVDSVVEVVELPAEAVVPAGEGLVRGEATLDERAVRVLALSSLGAAPDPAQGSAAGRSGRAAGGAKER
jgi:chemotaxis signal transduction protein